MNNTHINLDSFQESDYKQRGLLASETEMRSTKSQMNTIELAKEKSKRLELNRKRRLDADKHDSISSQDEHFEFNRRRRFEADASDARLFLRMFFN